MQNQVRMSMQKQEKSGNKDVQAFMIKKDSFQLAPHATVSSSTGGTNGYLNT